MIFFLLLEGYHLFKKRLLSTDVIQQKDHLTNYFTYFLVLDKIGNVSNQNNSILTKSKLPWYTNNKNKTRFQKKIVSLGKLIVFTQLHYCEDTFKSYKVILTFKNCPKFLFSSRCQLTVSSTEPMTSRQAKTTSSGI